MSIKIIGAGFPRTGTNTLKESLELLGFNKTYHMKQLLVHPENLHYWTTLKETGTTNWEATYMMATRLLLIFLVIHGISST